MLSVFMLIVIVANCVNYILASEPSMMYKPTTCVHPACDDDPVLCPGIMMCEPIPFEIFDLIETISVAIFTVDYLTRVFTVPFVPAV